jgi:hypothetical protein
METVVWLINLFIVSEQPPSTLSHLPSVIFIEYLYRIHIILVFRVDYYLKFWFSVVSIQIIYCSLNYTNLRKLFSMFSHHR